MEDARNGNFVQRNGEAGKLTSGTLKERGKQDDESYGGCEKCGTMVIRETYVNVNIENVI